MYGLPTELYTMNRGIKFKSEMRWDETIIPPLVINGQFNKTKGHKHKETEYYQVLEGEAIFVFQTKGKFEVHKLKKGEDIIVPSNAYHITINPSKNKTLKLGNWIDDRAVSDYSYVDKKKGLAYYYMDNGSWVTNWEYKTLPEFKC